MEPTLYYLFWALVFVVMMRWGCGRHIFGHGNHKSKPQHKSKGAITGQQEQMYWEAPAKDVDPVCQKVVTTAKAKSSVNDGKVYYFCSRDCREAFEAAPDIYLSEGSRSTNTKLEKNNG